MRFKQLPLFLCILPLLALPPARAEERVDLDAIHRIKTEAFENSKVMDHIFYLTDVNGPRLANSPGFFAAADWVVKQLKEWGINARQEKWGPFGRGWTYTHYSASMTAPQYAPLIGFPLAWSASTNGTVSGEPIQIEQPANVADLEKLKGTLKGKIVLMGGPRNLAMLAEAPGRRYSDADLAAMIAPPDPGAGFQRPPGAPTPAQAREFQTKLNQFLADEHPLVLVRGGAGRSETGDVFGAGGGSRDPKDPIAPPSVVLTPEHYNRISRLLEHKIPVRLEFDIQTKTFDDRTDSVNVIGEIEGGRKKDQIVMLGAHLDSWQGGTGATDNGAGSAVMIEALRILKTLNLKMDRTVRLALWSGEEEGLLGSKAYVKEHFGDPETMKVTAEHSKLAGYFNVDNGTGKIRGIYLQGNDMMRPIAEAWLAPFHDLGATTVTIRNTGGTDHQSFDAVGLPGFQFIQDPMDYNSRTHHSNMDLYDRIQKGDLMQMAAIVASFVYETAMRDEMLPRKPLPKARPAEGAGTPATATGGGGGN
jgi:carboxypeptidase Q